MRSWKTFLLIPLLAGCSLRPYDPGITVEMPEEWRNTEDTSSTDFNIDWWEQFNEPVLTGYIREAVENNRDLQMAAARVWEFACRAGITRSALFPEIDANGQETKQEISIDLNPLPAGTSRITNQYNLLLNLSYEIDVWGRIRNATDAAMQDMFAQESVRRTVLLDLIASVAATYFQLLKIDLQLAVSQQTVESRAKSFDLAKLRFEGGLTSELEVRQAESEVESAAVEVVRLKQSQEIFENVLSLLLGRTPSPIERGKPIQDFDMPAQVPAGLPSDLLRQRPDLMEADERLYAATSRIGEARADYFPKFSLTGFYGNESIELAHLLTGRARTWQYGLGFFEPIFTAGRIRYQVDLRKAQELEAFYGYEEAILNALKEVENALVSHARARELIVLQKKRVGINRDYLRLARLQFDEGETDYLSVLDAERNLFLVELEYADVQANLFITLVELYKALGNGWECF